MCVCKLQCFRLLLEFDFLLSVGCFNRNQNLFPRCGFLLLNKESALNSNQFNFHKEMG